MIAFLAAEARRFGKEIAAEIDKDPLWARLAAALRSVKGVAGRTVARILAQLPEIGVYSNKAIVKLAGLTPYAHQSGQWRGRSFIGSGRKAVRSALFVSAMVAARHNPVLKAFRGKFVQSGKPKIVALARKLLTILNAIVREARDEPMRCLEDWRLRLSFNSVVSRPARRAFSMFDTTSCQALSNC